MSAPIEGRPRAQDLFNQIGVETYREAYRLGRNLSTHLERLDPSEGYNDGLDAFSRMCKVAGVVTRSRPEIGVFADELRKFEETEPGRMLIPELFSRMWRSAAAGRPVDTRGIYTASDDIPGGTALPKAFADGARSSRRAPPFRLSEIVAITTPVDAQVYQAYYLTTDATESRMARVPEGTDVPMAKLTGGDQSIKLKKYGRGIQATYEALRRVRIDKVGLWIAQLAIQAEMDKISAAIKVLVEGDGNNNAATNWRAKTDLDAAATGKTVTLRSYLGYKLKWAPAYQLTHLIGAEGDMLKVLLLNVGTAGATVPMYLADVTSTISSGMTLRDGVRAGITTDTPTDKFVGIDAAAALEYVVEVGSNIEEVERHARRQVQEITMTEVVGFAVFDKEATKTLELES